MPSSVSHIDELLRIIAKTAEYGRLRAYNEKHSRNIDSFQHIEDEAARASKWLRSYYDEQLRVQAVYEGRQYEDHDCGSTQQEGEQACK